MATGQVFSIGHGKHSLGALFDQLRCESISYLVDVRSAPYSRHQPEFSREPLAQSLRENHIKYVFMGDLLGGRPKDDSCYTDGRVDYSKIREKKFFSEGIDRLVSAHNQGLNICLLCSEAHPKQCHRAKLIGEALSDLGIDVTHILPDGSRKAQSDVIAELTGAQPSFFAEHFVSRKAYR